MRKRPLAAALLALVAWIMVGRAFHLPLYIHEGHEYRLQEEVPTGRTVIARGRLGDIEEDDERYAITLYGTVVARGAESYRLRQVRLYVEKDDTRSGRSMLTDGGCAIGDRITATGKIRYGTRPTNPGQFDQATYHKSQKIACVLSRARIEERRDDPAPVRNLLQTWRVSLRRRMLRIFPADVAPMLLAMLLGDRSLLDEDWRELYAAGGVAHLLVISGLHLHLLSMGLYRLLLKAGGGARMSGTFVIGWLLFYVLLTGVRVSSARALLMVTLQIGATMCGRMYDRWNAVMVSALLILLVNPYALFTAGFYLSFGAVTFCYLIPVLGKVVGTVFLHFGMAPLLAWFFYVLPLYSIVVNAILIPLLPFILVTGGLGLMLGGPMTVPAVLLLRFQTSLLHIVQRLPYANIICGKPSAWRIFAYSCIWILALVAVLRNRERRRRYLILPVFLPALLLLFHPAPRELTVAMLDIGQGDAIILESPEGVCMIDGGSSSEEEIGRYKIVPYLKHQGIRTIDVIFVSHFDMDHVSGLFALLSEDTIRVRQIAFPRRVKEGDIQMALREAALRAGTKVRICEAGDAYVSGALRMEVLWPSGDAGGATLEENAMSMVLYVRYGAFDALFTGDLEEEGERALLQTRNIERDVSFLKVGHHGSRTSSGEAFLSFVMPDVAGISCGRNNAYGHPHEDVLWRLHSIGARVCRTDEDGAVFIQSNGERMTVFTYCS